MNQIFMDIGKLIIIPSAGFIIKKGWECYTDSARAKRSRQFHLIDIDKKINSIQELERLLMCGNGDATALLKRTHCERLGLYFPVWFNLLLLSFIATNDIKSDSRYLYGFLNSPVALKFTDKKVGADNKRAWIAEWGTWSILIICNIAIVMAFISTIHSYLSGSRQLTESVVVGVLSVVYVVMFCGWNYILLNSLEDFYSARTFWKMLAPWLAQHHSECLMVDKRKYITPSSLIAGLYYWLKAQRYHG